MTEDEAIKYVMNVIGNTLFQPYNNKVPYVVIHSPDRSSLQIPQLALGRWGSYGKLGNIRPQSGSPTDPVGVSFESAQRGKWELAMWDREAYVYSRLVRGYLVTSTEKYWKDKLEYCDKVIAAYEGKHPEAAFEPIHVSTTDDIYA